ncbi:MAG: TldD/PmbA family protein [Armatimonadota bacterium]
MHKIFENIVNNKEVDYSDVRYEQITANSIHYSGKELKDINQSSTHGGFIRVLNKNGLGMSSFNTPEQALSSFNTAKESSLLVSENTQEKLNFAPAEPVKDEIYVDAEIDPRTISLEEKKNLLSHYNDMILSSENIFNTDLSYIEVFWDKYFLSSEGARIKQEQMIVYIGGSIYAKSGDIIQQVRLSLGGSQDYKALLKREDTVKKQIKLAQDLLKAEKVTAGTYTVLLDPEIAGVFIHEAFGHLSEADLLENNPIKDKMKLGDTFGTEILNVVDDGTLYGKPGYYEYDDEGVPSQKTYLIEDGVLSGRLHNRKTALNFGEPITGNARAENFSFEPIIRMSNIYIDNGNSTFERLLKYIKNGLYIIGAKGGQTGGDVYTFGAQAGYMIEDGKLTKMVRDINLSGNLFETLKNITGIADDLTFSESGGCGKGGQTLWKSGVGSPHVRVEKVAVGGC